MTTKLHQVIAVESTVKSDAQAALARAGQLLANPGLFTGQVRTYAPRADDGARLPDERAVPQFRGEDVVGEASRTLVRLFDVVAQKDWTDPAARADLVVDGEVLLADVPVTYLLFLDRQLAALMNLVTSLPLLDPSEEWLADDTSGMWRSEARQTVRTRKVPKAHVLYPATPEHPAQVQAYTVDEPEGDWTTTRFSTAFPATRVTQLRERIRRLQEAVKFAREAGNSAEVVEVAPGRKVLDWVFQGA
jgi:hypothetical protein